MYHEYKMNLDIMPHGSGFCVEFNTGNKYTHRHFLNLNDAFREAIGCIKREAISNGINPDRSFDW